MAVDTQNKRRSVLASDIETLSILPVPDDSVDAIDRPAVIGFFARNISAVNADDVWERAFLVKKTERGDELTTAALPPGSFRVFIKAFDTTGNESEEAAFASVIIENTFDLVFSEAEGPRWAGEKNNCIVHNVSGRIVPLSEDADSTGNNFDVFDTFVLNSVSAFSYEAAEIDIGFDDDGLRVWGESSVALGPNVTGNVTKALQIDYRDNADSYDGFENWTIGRVNARFVKHKLTVNNTSGVAYIDSFTPTVDVEERVEKEQNVAVPVSGTTITYPNRFINAPTVELTPLGSTPLIAMVDNITATGFYVTAFNTSGTDVGGTINYTATGV